MAPSGKDDTTYSSTLGTSRGRGHDIARLTRAESRERTRERLRISARRLIAERGYAGASVDLIAEGADFSRGAFYSNYNTKDELLLELLEEYFAHELRSLSRAIDDAGDDPKAVRRAVRSLYARWTDDVNWSLLTTEFFLHALRDEDFRVAFIERYGRHRDEVTALLARYLALAGGDKRRAKRLGPMVMGMALGYALQAAAEPDRFERRPLGEALTDFMKLIAPEDDR